MPQITPRVLSFSRRCHFSEEEVRSFARTRARRACLKLPARANFKFYFPREPGTPSKTQASKLPMGCIVVQRRANLIRPPLSCSRIRIHPGQRAGASTQATYFTDYKPRDHPFECSHEGNCFNWNREREREGERGKERSLWLINTGPTIRCSIAFALQ